MTDLRPGPAVAAFDSATAMLRATANALQGEDFPSLGRGTVETMPARLSSLLPVRPRQFAFTIAGAAEGIPARRLADVDMDSIAEWVVSHYPRRWYPGAAIGSSNGAAVHAWTAAGIPWLPQTVLIPVRWSDGDPDDPAAALEFGRRAAPPLLDRNPGIQLHHTHDGNRDRLMVSRMTYFRVKWTTLPEAYAEFLSACLPPGAPIVLMDDQSTWPTVTVDERHVFQTGALGGLAPEDYLERFHAPTPDSKSPEAEWGFDIRLAESITALATRHQNPIVRVDLPDPQSLAEPVAELLRGQIRSAGGRGDRLLVESFVMLDPVQAFRSGSAPYWTFFGVESALRAVREHLARANDNGDPYRDVDVLSFPNGVASKGSVAPDQWAGLRHYITGRVRLLAGTRERWPTHFDTLVTYGRALRSLPDGVDSPAPPNLTVDETVRALRRDDTIRLKPRKPMSRITPWSTWLSSL